MKIKKCLSMVMVATMLMSTSVFASENTTETAGVETLIIKLDTMDVEQKVTTSEDEIEQILKSKGIFDENEEVLAVIEINSIENNNIDENTFVDTEAHWISREIYVKNRTKSTGTEYSPKYTNNYPAGSFNFRQAFYSGWKLAASLGLKVEVFEAALNYEIDSSVTEEFVFNSISYAQAFTVKAYVNYEKESFRVYDRDLIYDDYIGYTSVRRETGYTIKVVSQ